MLSPPLDGYLATRFKDLEISAQIVCAVSRRLHAENAGGLWKVSLFGMMGLASLLSCALKLGLEPRFKKHVSCHSGERSSGRAQPTAGNNSATGTASALHFAAHLKLLKAKNGLRTNSKKDPKAEILY